ncbi:bacteriocin-processing peptidase. Cysteine peptidase. MEROPS family C39 [bacterium A37T11]|nr:bacteriocin-processing peptidase. Cysteine peptidase. MEROPS family C39 [bacterium A37T11]
MTTLQQHDQSDCGAACIQAVAAHYGLRSSIAAIRLLAGTDGTGSTMLGLQTAAERMGFVAGCFSGPYEGLQEARLPAILHLEREGGHFVVVYRAGTHKVRYLDPADGKLHKTTVSAFCKPWSGSVMFLEPGPHFVQNPSPAGMTKQCWRLLYPYRAWLVKALAASAFSTLLAYSGAFFVQLFTDRVIPAHDPALLHHLGFAFSLLLVIQGSSSVAARLLSLRSGKAMDERLLQDYCGHLLRLPARFFDQMRTGEIFSRVNDALKIRYFINDTLIHLSVPVFILLFTLMILISGHPRLGWIILLSLPLYIAVYWLSNRLNKGVQRRIMEQDAALDDQLTENLQAIHTIQQLGLEPQFDQQVRARIQALTASQHQSGRNSVFTEESTGILSQALSLALLWSGGQYLLQGGISLGELLSFYTLSGYFSRAVLLLMPFNKTYQDARIAAERLFDILSLAPQEKPESTLVHPEQVSDICLQNVCFGYQPGRSVLHDLSLHIPSGQFVAISGSPGSGKSTLFHLLLKQYTPDSGQIRLGIYPLSLVGHASLSRLIAVVPQQVHLFHGSLLHNICPGITRPDTPRLVALCHSLGLLPLIESLPDGFDSPVGENGCLLSGGQRQLLSLARALYRQPSVLLLDEPTAALDATSTATVHACLKKLQEQGVTILLISHQASSLLAADRVVHLADGHIQYDHMQTYHNNPIFSPLSTTAPTEEPPAQAAG